MAYESDDILSYKPPSEEPKPSFGGDISDDLLNYKPPTENVPSVEFASDEVLGYKPPALVASTPSPALQKVKEQFTSAPLGGATPAPTPASPKGVPPATKPTTFTDAMNKARTRLQDNPNDPEAKRKYDELRRMKDQQIESAMNVGRWEATAGMLEGYYKGVKPLLSGLSLGLTNIPLNTKEKALGVEGVGKGTTQAEQYMQSGLELLGGLGSGAVLSKGVSGAPIMKQIANPFTRALVARTSVGALQGTTRSLGRLVAEEDYTAKQAGGDIAQAIVSSAVSVLPEGVGNKAMNVIGQVATDFVTDLGIDSLRGRLKDQSFRDWFVKEELMNLIPSLIGASATASKSKVEFDAEVKALRQGMADSAQRIKDVAKRGVKPEDYKITPAPKVETQADLTTKAIEMPFKTAKEFGQSLKSSETFLRPNNKIDEPYKGEFIEGERYIDPYGDNPYVFESRYVNPSDLINNLNMEGRTYSEVVAMPTTQKYIEWYKQGNQPPPIDVVRTDQGNLKSTNRRRIIAAIEAGVDKVPALVEIGRRNEMFEAIKGEAQRVEATVPAPYPKLFAEAKSKGLVESGDKPTRTELAEKIAKSDAEQAELDSAVKQSVGASSASEFGAERKFTQSSTKSAIDEERVKSGMEPIEAPVKQALGDAYSKAEEMRNEDAQWQDRLISEINEKPRAVEPFERAGLLQRRIDLMNQRDKAWKRQAESRNAGYEDMAMREEDAVARINSEIDAVDTAMRQSGSAAGRDLQAIKMVMDQDFTPVRMEREMAASKGRPLTQEEVAEVRALSDEITAKGKAIDERVKARETETVDKGIDAEIESIAKTTKPRSKTEKAKADADRPTEMQKIVTRLEEKLKAGDTEDIYFDINKLTRMFVESGIKTREPLVDAVHGVLQKIDPTFTREKTRDAISGYGNFKPLSKDEISVTVRDLKGQLQQTAKLRDIENKTPPKKSGMEKREPSDEERRLIKQVNEAKRKYGISTTDPAKQLKSSLDARKTAMKNQIKDLQWQIDNLTKIIKDKTPPPSDTELQDLIKVRDSLKQEYTAIFGNPKLSLEQQHKLATASAERNLAYWNGRLAKAKGGTFGVTKKPKISTLEIEAIKAKTEASKKEVQRLYDLANPKPTAEQLANQRALRSAKKALEESTARLKRAEAGDFSKDAKKSPVSTPETVAIRAKIAEQQARIKELHDKAHPPLTAEQKAMKAAISAAENNHKKWEERLAQAKKGIFDVPVREKLTGTELDAVRAKTDALKAEVQALKDLANPKLTPEQKATRMLNARIAQTIERYQQRIAEGNFAPTPRKSATPDAETNRLMAEREMIKKQYYEKMIENKMANRTWGQKIKDRAVETLNVFKALKSSFDLSAILNQGGWFAVSHPIMSAKALSSLKAIRSDTAAEAVNMEIKNRPNGQLYKKAGLALTERGVSLSKMEEAYASRWAGKIPGIGASERVYSAFLNRLRADMFDSLSKTMSKTGTPTLEESRAIATFINEASGRGGLGSAEPASLALANILWSPRRTVSRFQMLAGHSMWGGTARSRKLIAQEYGRFLAGIGTVYALANAAGAEIEDDPKSSDFGKIKMGNVRIDPLSGLSQTLTFASRMATGFTKTGEGLYKKVSTSDLAGKFLKNKLAPLPTMAFDISAAAKGEKDFEGNVTTPKDVAFRAMPISFQDIVNNLQENGVAKATALSLVAFLGAGVNSYEQKNKTAFPKSYQKDYKLAKEYDKLSISIDKMRERGASTEEIRTFIESNATDQDVRLGLLDKMLGNQNALLKK